MPTTRYKFVRDPASPYGAVSSSTAGVLLPRLVRERERAAALHVVSMAQGVGLHWSAERNVTISRGDKYTKMPKRLFDACLCEFGV